MAETRHVVVSGRVQGVGYRAFVADLAARHGITGWVRNCSDGTVEAMLSGEAAVLDILVAALRQGPRGAKVQDVLVTPVDDPVPSRFAILPTA